MAYTFSVNNTPADGTAAIYQLITTLVSAGWLRKMDSDGTTYSSAGTQVTHAGIGPGGLNNNNAWIRIQSPPTNGGSVVNQTRELTFQRGNAAVNWRIKYSASALFTGGSPAATVTPSSTDEVFMIGSGTDASPGYVAYMFNTGTFRWHIACGGAAEFYSFIAWSLQNGSTITYGPSIALDVMAPGSYSVLDVDPAVMFCSTLQNYTPSNLVNTTFPTVNVVSIGRAWLGATSAVGASITSNNVSVCMVPYGTGVIGNGANVAGTNPWTNKDDLLPCLWGSQVTTGPVRGIKGFSTLFMHGSVHRLNMETTDSTIPGTKDKVYISPLWFPWSGDEPII
jgi:hypothetical protein